MSETTQILFNSPALHSLKRDQLVKLCKIHSIKANGKNIDLIDRLKQHALTLPEDDPLRIAAKTDNDSGENKDADACVPDLASVQTPRPSEQWEVVMESIEEVEETTPAQGTMASSRSVESNHVSGEFGTSNSKASTVGSSIRALANSLGLKRKFTKTDLSPSKCSSATGVEVDNALPSHELMQVAAPYSATRPAMPPLKDIFTFDPTAGNHTNLSAANSTADPLPGCALRPGVPAPPHARLSLGLGLGQPSTPSKQQQPTTTIRLVSSQNNDSHVDALNDNAQRESNVANVFQTPKLKPFETTFDLIMSPSGQAAGAGSFWAPSLAGKPSQFPNIHPTLSKNDFPPSVPTSPYKIGTDATEQRNDDSDVQMSDNALPTPPDDDLFAPAKQNMRTDSTNQPFVFGSPNPPPNIASPNTQFRFAATSVLEEMNKRLQSEGVDSLGAEIINNLHPGVHTQEQLQREVRPLPRQSKSGQGGEITRKFNDAHQAAFDKMEGIDGLVKRRTLMTANDEPRQIVGKKRKSSVLGDTNGLPRRPTTGPGAAATAPGGRTSGTTRVISNGRRAKTIPGAFGGDEDEAGRDAVEVEGRKEGKRRRTNINETRPDVNAMEVDNDGELKRKQEREREVLKRKLEISREKRRSSINASAAAKRKSGRVSVNNGVSAAKAKPSRFGFLASAKNLVTSVWNRGKAGEKTPASGAAKVKPAPKKDGTSGGKSSSSSFSKTPAPSSTSGLGSTSTNNGRLSVHPQQGGKLSARARSPIPSFGKSSRASSMNESRQNNTTNVGGISSLGTRGLGARTFNVNTGATGNTPGSMGVKRIGGASSLGLSSPSNIDSKVGFTTRTIPSSSSRLLAPTASSLAKTRKLPEAFTPNLTAEPNMQVRKKVPLLGGITNSPHMGGTVLSPTPASRLTTTTLLSPKALPSKIFSKPVSGIPVPSSAKNPSSSENETEPREQDAENEKPNGQSQLTAGQRSLNRKPRISRSKVIARLASQRAAATGTASRAQCSVVGASGGGVGGNGVKPRTSAISGPLGQQARHRRARSSFGPRPGRANLTGANGGAALREKERDVLASAKKRVRQSEYLRRRSQVVAAGNS